MPADGARKIARGFLNLPEVTVEGQAPADTSLPLDVAGGLFGVDKATALANSGGHPEAVTGQRAAPDDPDSDTLNAFDMAKAANPGGYAATYGADQPTPTIPQGGGDAGAAPVASGGVTVPAHWSPSTASETVKEGVAIPQEAKNAAGVADGLSQQVATRDMMIAKQKAAADVAYEGQRLRAEEAERAALDRNHAEQNQYVSTQLAKIQQLSDQSHAKVNTEEAWGPYGGARIFSMFLTALAPVSPIGGILGKEMSNMIDSRVQERIKEQEQNIRLGREGLESQGNLLKQNLDAFGAKDKAILATKANLLDLAKVKLDQAYAEQKDPAAESAYLKLSSDLAEKRKNVAVDFAKLEHADITREQHVKYVQAQTGGVADSKDKPLLITTSDGRTFRAQTPESYNKITTFNGLVDDIKGLHDEALALRKSASVADLANPYSTVHKQLASLQARASQQITVAAGQGAMSKGDQEVAKEGMGDWTGVMGNNDAVIKSSRNGWGKLQDRAVKALGAEEIRREYGKDKHGDVVPTPKYTGKSTKPANQAMPAGAKKIGP